MTTISAKSLLASVSAYGPTRRGDTFELVYPRAIHAEFMTHRQIGKNASSSRAKPVKKIIDEIMENPFVPLHWGKNQKGMQAYETNDALVDVGKFMNFGHSFTVDNEKAWLLLRDAAVKMAEAFDAAGYHKQIINRLLEPWAHIKVVATASQWTNFFGLRTHSAAEPHFQILANEILNAYNTANVQLLEECQWHAPYTDDLDDSTPIVDALKTSVARCASTSYDTVEGNKMMPQDVDRIFNQLVGSQPVHASPAEHQFRFDDFTGSFTPGQADDSRVKWSYPKLGGNLGAGFIQYRKLLPNETITSM
jgi:hypothetical protein